MTLELDDEELTDVREALRVQLIRLVGELSHTEQNRFVSQLRARFERVEELYRRTEKAPVTGEISATH